MKCWLTVCTVEKSLISLPLLITLNKNQLSRRVSYICLASGERELRSPNAVSSFLFYVS